jgi:predicted nucleotidyltransferase
MTRRDRLRHLIAREAARLMYEEEIKEYLTAKRKAARAFGPEKRLCLGHHLPSNSEIHAELQRLIALREPEVLPGRLLHMRILALKFMELLAPFRPYLIGSVLSGSVTERSDIDLHLFADDPEEVENFLAERHLHFSSETVTIHKGGKFRDYPHIYLEENGIILELSIFTPKERQNVPRSSITGKAMERADAKKLRRLIARSLGGEEKGH